MEKKINLVELLKDCPNGMELDCILFDDVKFEKCSKGFVYICRNNGELFALNKDGSLLEVANSKCIIFPKGKTTWEGFMPTVNFKDGDVVVNQNNIGAWIGIYHKYDYLNDTFYSHCYIRRDGIFCANSDNNHGCYKTRLATEDEKETLFKAIKENGYKWDEENKTLEKLVPNKFDIATLKPFESKVLVRDIGNEKWRPAIWGFFDSDSKCDYPYKVVSGYSFSMCIPYNGNEHLLGKTKDCNDFYKTWE